MDRPNIPDGNSRQHVQEDCDDGPSYRPVIFAAAGATLLLGLAALAEGQLIHDLGLSYGQRGNTEATPGANAEHSESRRRHQV